MTLGYAPRLSGPTTINLNDRVRVRLNDRGWKIHRENHDNLFMNDPKVLAEFPYRKPEVGADGCVEFHLWELAHIFGAHLWNGCEVPFETNCVLVPCT